MAEESSRDKRQQLSVKHWKDSKGHGTIVAGTGYGKTRVAMNIITKFVELKPLFRVIIIVPTTVLKDQWEKELDERQLQLNCQVVVINTAIENSYSCDLLVIDEIQRMAADTFRQVFNVVSYKLILGLTATFERLDGKHQILEQYCPVCDNVPLTECLLNGWVAPYKIYKILVDVDDIEEYKQYNKEFVQHFEFFSFDWSKVMSCIGKTGFIARAKLRDEMCPDGSDSERKAVFTQITYHATGFMRALQKRKAFINNHVKKIDIARKIIEARPFSKIITFSNNVKMAESIGMGGKVYTGKVSKKKGRTTIEEFNQCTTGILHSCQKCNEGVNIAGLSVGIVLGLDSSELKSTQRIGRVCRFEPGKQAEMFYIVINDTVECEWCKKALGNQQYITIDEQGLEDVLAYKEPQLYKKKIKDFQFRF